MSKPVTTSITEEAKMICHVETGLDFYKLDGERQKFWLRLAFRMRGLS